MHSPRNNPFPTAPGRRHSGRYRMLMFTGVFSLLLAVPSARSQIQLDIKLDHPAYLTGEAFAARVRIENSLSVPMVMDKDYHNTELIIELTRRSEGTAAEGRRMPVSRDTVIMPDQQALELIEITSLFDMREKGGYQVRAIIRYDGKLYLSQPVAFDIVRGIEILSARRGLPGYHEIDLIYSLRYWKRRQGEQAFMVIEDAERGIIYGTFVLGPLVRVIQPAILFDAQGRAVAVHQSGRNRLTRSVFTVDPNGAAMIDRTHHMPDGRPYPGSIQEPPPETGE